MATFRLQLIAAGTCEQEPILASLKIFTDTLLT
jgi:hypothetical protein